MLIAALFTIARTWKQPRCPSVGNWIKKLWQIYTVDYYSAIKKKVFQFVLMMWMNIEPVIQSEVRKRQTSYINAYIWNLEKMVLMNRFGGSHGDTQRTDSWTQWGKERVGRIERVVWKHRLYHMYNQIASGSLLYDAGSSNLCSVTTQRDGMGWEVGGRLKERIYVCLWLIHVDAWQKPTQYRNYPSIKNKLIKDLKEGSCSQNLWTQGNCRV